MLKIDGWKYPGAQVNILNNVSLKLQVWGTNGTRDTRDTNFLGGWSDGRTDMGKSKAPPPTPGNQDQK